MKMITLEKLRDSLRDWKHVVTVPPETAALLFDIADADEAHRIANEIGIAIRVKKVTTAAGTAEITASIGVVSLDQSVIGKADPLIAADGAMYAAKQNGRDRIEIAA